MKSVEPEEEIFNCYGKKSLGRSLAKIKLHIEFHCSFTLLTLQRAVGEVQPIFVLKRVRNQNDTNNTACDILIKLLLISSYNV